MAFQLHKVEAHHKTTATTIRTTVTTNNYARATSSILFSNFEDENHSSSIIDLEDDSQGNPNTSKSNNDENDDDDDGDDNKDNYIPTASAASFSSSSIFQRFLNPRIDDPGLLLSDALLAQIVAPTLQIYWLLLANAPSPSWLHSVSGGGVRGSSNLFSTSSPLFGVVSSRGSLLAPTLVHGAGLAVCWLAGALAAKMFEKEV